MKDLIRLVLKHKKFSGIFLLLTLVYIVESVIRPVDKAALTKYHLTNGSAHALVLGVILPYVLIWLIALVGCLKLRSYTRALGASKDGKAFGTISTGITWFTLWLPLSTLLSGLATAIYNTYPGVTASVVRLLTYANVVLLIPAFLGVYTGSKQLVGLVRTKVTAPTIGVTLLYIALTVLYATLVLHDTNRMLPDSTSRASYYLPDWLLVTTVIIPRLLFWFLGVLAVQNIIIYRQKVKGVLYKEALQSLAIGIAGVTMGIVALRIIQSLAVAINKLSLAAMLAVIYVLLILLSVGYVYMARGADKLLRIEES